MKRIFYSLSMLCLGFCAFTIHSPAQGFDYGGNIFSTGTNDIARDIAIIDNSLAYKIVVGSYQPVSTSGTYNGFVVARDASENLKWWIDIQGNGNDEVNGVDVRTRTSGNLSYGDIYITGYFTGTMTMVLHYGFPLHDFTTTIHTHSAPSGNSNDCTYFLTKLDQDGGHVWTQVSGTSTQTNTEIGNDVDVSLVGSEVQVYTTGFFRGTTSFFSGGTPTLSSNASWNGIFTAKYVDNGSSSTCSWAVKVNDNSDNQHDYGYGVTGDGNGNVFMVGSIGGNTTIAGNTKTVSGNDDAIAVKYNSSGTEQWGLNFGGSGTIGNPSDQARGVSFYSGYIYVSGYFNGSSGDFTNWSTVTQAGFIAKIYDNTTSGSIYRASTIISAGSDICYRNTISPNGDWCYVVGNITGNAYIKAYNGGIIWSPYLDVSGISGGANADGFIALFNTSDLATVNDAEWIGGDDYSDVATGVACLNNSKIYICGGYRSSFVYDMSATIMDVNSNPSTLDAFWGRYISGFSPRIGSFDNTTTRETSEAQAYPNPVTDQLTISGSFDDNATVGILDMTGRSVIDAQKINGDQILIDTHNLPAGIYFAQIISGEKTKMIRIVKE
jgi:hypothetical protein